ncbi:MAG: hypothetical protein E6Y56_04260 [Negativicoccus succinicivorans]|uniref:hypothetical protein n=1 Tax=Negativicoccus succinicivorans TaxID=620903 RepID=UPI002911A622|nr:hypothetical protein [Negativicoccus succinicivorans]MDU4558776.1 hypothetical protein [Negativicoccus succinicivorans]
MAWAVRSTAGFGHGATGGRQAARILSRIGGVRPYFTAKKIKSGVAAFFVRENRRNKKAMVSAK